MDVFAQRAYINQISLELITFVKYQRLSNNMAKARSKLLR